MKLKQFLKPDWRKIFLCGVMIISGSLPSFIKPITLFSRMLLMITWWPVYAVKLGGLLDGLYLKPPIFDPIADFIFFTAILITPIFWYFLSCLIIWIYDKFKKGKKKK